MIWDEITNIKNIRNAKQEFLNVTFLHKEFNKVKCVRLRYDGKFYDLLVGYTQQDYEKFLESINFEYDAGYGTQKITGTIWITDGSWYERSEYDGLEWWEYKSTPPIPKQLNP